MSSVDELVKAAKKFLKDTWNEDTVSMKITKNEVVNGNGKLHTDCVVRLSVSNETPSKWHKVLDEDLNSNNLLTSRWHKVFTFENGKIIDEEYHLIYEE